MGKARLLLKPSNGRVSMLGCQQNPTMLALVQRIGNVGVFYRARKDKPRIILPD